MKLYIAEKPDVAKAIVAVLGNGQRGNGYIQCGPDIVTWCYGHMLQLSDPEDYDEKYKKWNFADLPFSHIPWTKKVSPDKQDQVNIIKELLSRASEVIHAGDPDDEGQLIVDELLDRFNCRLPVQRVFINDNNESVVKRALSKAQDNRKFKGLSNAAEARSVGDQLYGYNMTRAYTLAAQAAGYQGTLSVGRVQTPVLGLIVRRDRENSSHQSSFYYAVAGTFNFNNTVFNANYKTKESDPVNEKKQLINKQFSEELARSLIGKTALIKSSNTNAREEAPPLPYSILRLQMDCSRKFGYKSDQVIDITQALREKYKLITYNRSDCQYLNDDHHSDAPEVLAAIIENAPILAIAGQRADPKIKGKAFNNAKTTAHHGIIPTISRTSIDKLTEPEKNIYLLIARTYIAQFWPNYKYNQTEVLLNVENHEFGCTSNVTTSNGWKALYKNDADNMDISTDESAIDTDLQTLKASQSGLCENAVSNEYKTKPRPLYTEATLLDDLRQVVKYVQDPKIKQLLLDKDKEKGDKEKGGIGTPSTRHTILKTLRDRGYVEDKGKYLVSTKTGQELYDSLPDAAKFPDMTALWHEQQMEIVEGNIDIPTFITDLMDFIGREVADVKNNGLKTITRNTIACPKCKKPLRRMKGVNGFFWGCTGYKEGCKASFKDKGGAPDLTGSNVEVSQLHKCMSCNKGLVRRKSIKGKQSSYFWSCSGFPDCKQLYPDLKGKPDYSKPKIKGA